MADEGLDLSELSRARLHSRSSRNSGFGLVYHHRKSVVATSLVCGDLAAALAAVSCSDFALGLTGIVAPAPQLFMAPLVVFVFSIVGFYSGSGPGPYERFRQRVLGIAGSIAISTIATIPGPHLSEFILAQFSNAAWLLLMGHYVEAPIRSLLVFVDFWGAPTILVGPADDCRELARVLARKPDVGLKPIGFIRTADHGNSNGGPLPLPELGTTIDVGKIQLRPRAEVAIFTTAIDLISMPRNCPAFEPFCRFMLLEHIPGIHGRWVYARAIDTLTAIEVPRNLRRRHNQPLKRMFDLLVAIPLGLLILPALGLATMMIKLVDPGPVFYVQKRIGRNGAIVNVLKLRTMYTDSDRRLQEQLERNPLARSEWQRFFKLRHDPRVLPMIGNLLRRSSADELPQLWNVICGDMSLVGPRPLPPYHAERFDEDFRSLRASVPPGLTGLWQVSSRSDGDLEILREQDLFYIRNWSHLLDFYILLQTVPAVMSARGAR
jgi:Undecaprenyl-phosphate galactose phosphotransferase WbaP